MSCLSIFGRGGKGARVAANPIYIITALDEPQNAIQFEFEVLEDDATMLRNLVGEQAHFAMGSEWAFWGVLDSLVPTESTHPGLSLIHGRRVLKGVMTIYPEAGSVN
jgi:hypothetical protein